MSVIGELVVSIIGDTKKLHESFSEIDKEFVGVAKEFKKTGKEITSAGKTMSKYVTVPLVGIGALSLHTAVNFDDAMRKVQAVSGATGDEFEQLRNQARELGATTAFSASDAADAMYYLALAGWDVNQIMTATPGLLSLASAAGIDLGTSADIVSDTMSAFQMEASRAGEAADIFAAASSNANTDIQQLGEAMKYAGPAANAAGMDLAKTSAILGILADSGIKGGMAGTTFTAMLRDMKKAAEDGSFAIGNATIALYNQDGTMRDMGAVMADIEAATKDMTTAQKDAALGAIFGEYAIKGVNIMLATGADRYNELEAAIYNSEGAAAKMAETMEGGAGGAIREMESAIEELMIAVGDILIVAVVPLILALTDFFNLISSIPEPILEVIMVVAAIAAAIGPLLILVGMTISSIGTILTFVGGGSGLSVVLGVLATSFMGVMSAIIPLLPVIALLTAAVVGVYLAFTHWDEIKAILGGLWDSLLGTFDQIIGYLASIDFAGEGTRILQSLVNGFISIAMYPLEVISQVMTSIWNYLIGIDLSGAGAGILSSLANGMVSMSMYPGNVVINVINSIIRIISGVNLYNAGSNMMNTFVSGIQARIQAAYNAVREGLARINRLLPHSPAKEGPFKQLPNWDALFVSPVQQSLGDMKSTALGGLQAVAGTLQASAQSQVVNSNNVYGGNEFTIQSVNLSADYPFEKFAKDLEQYNRQKRIRRGVST